MDRQDRPDRGDRPGLPPSRGLPENPAQGRRLPSSNPQQGPNAGSGSGSGPSASPSGGQHGPGLANGAAPSGIPSDFSFHIRPPPPPSFMPSNRAANGLLASAPLTANQVTALAREAMREALRHTDQQAGDAPDVSNPLRPGLTIDLSRKNIQKLPDEVIDIVMNKLERLALSHNKLASLPVRFSECSSLRYLNVRDNDIREFPMPLCDLKSLEILDLGRNKLRELPPDIVKLTSLKVFALQKNRIEELPVCLADMTSLQMLKLSGNPIRFPPPDVFQVQAKTPPNEGYLAESEVTEVTVTTHIKRFLKQEAISRTESTTTSNNINSNATNASTGAATIVSATAPISLAGSGTVTSTGGSNYGVVRSGASVTSDSPAEDSSDIIDLPRVLPVKRVASGRFPVKVNGTEVGDLRSPPQPRPPPIPTRSHYRGLSQQNTAVRRPGVMPLTIGNPNERSRSNSETTLLPVPRGDRPNDRSRRMGIVSRKAQELGPLDEGEVSNDGNNRFSHYRGLSHGSAMTGNPNGSIAPETKSPASPSSDVSIPRPIYVRRLSILPERRRESQFFDPIVEAAKGVLYSVFQIHPMVQMLMGLANDGTQRRSSLEIVFYNTNSHVEQLEREIQRHEVADEDHRVTPHENETVHRACITLLHAYDHICSLLKSNVDLFLDNGDPRYLRTLLLQIYHSVMELRVAVASTNLADVHRKIAPSSSTSKRPPAFNVSVGDTMRPLQSLQSMQSLHPQPPQTIQNMQSAQMQHSFGPRDASLMSTPTAERPGLTVMRDSRNAVTQNPGNLRVATDVSLPSLTMPYINGSGRTATIMSVTPRSGESYTSSIPSSGSRGVVMSDFSDDDQTFEKIFLSLQRSTEVAMRLLPLLSQQYAMALRQAVAIRAPESAHQCWRLLLARCAVAIQQTEALKQRLSSVKLKEPGLRAQSSYWNLCTSFLDAWLEFANRVRESTGKIKLPPDTIMRMRPVHKSVKEAIELILRSPWAYTLRKSSLAGVGGIGGMGMNNISGPLSAGNGGDGLAANQPTQLPMTPQSAALGPAVQATVPSTPQSASFANAFVGNLYDRADALISAGGLSIARAATFSSVGATAGGLNNGAGGMSGSNSGLSSLNSTLNSSYGPLPAQTDSTMVSMMGASGSTGSLPFRLNNGKAGF